MRQLYKAIVLVLVLTVMASGIAMGLGIGDQIGPLAFETLEGHPRTMNNYTEREGTVVVFMSGRSETSIEDFPEINRLHEEYRLQEVLFVGIVSNPAESGEELRGYLQNVGCRFPVYRDVTGAAMKSVGATVTPELYIVDSNGALTYHGGLSGLEPALKALVKGKPAPRTDVPLEGTPILADLPARLTSDPYGAMYFASELLFEKIPGVAVQHCSTITEAPNGDLLVLWYAGSYESAEDQALYLARQKKGSRDWSTPECLLRNPEMPPGNAVIFTAPDGRVWILWGRMESSRPIRRGSGWGKCRLLYRTSDDSGVTWSADEEVPESLGWLPRNLPLTLSNGKFGIPLSGEAEEEVGSFILFLDPKGPTWTRGGMIEGPTQPTVIQQANGDLLCMMRNQPRIMQSISTDGGNTWSKASASVLKNPDSGICMVKLKSGRIVMAFNDTDQDDRTPFNLIQSYDDGKTWEDLRVIEGDWGEFSYPSIMQSSDGKIHLTYTYRRYSIKHVVFDEGWLTHLERPN